jgi:hypothetical protein
VPFATCDDFLQRTESLDFSFYHVHEDAPMAPVVLSREPIRPSNR